MAPRSLAASLAVAMLALAACGSSSSADEDAVLVKVGGGQVRTEVAADEAARRQGLAGRSSLPEDRGMLFVFPDRIERTFWMKGMRFPIDIIWIDRGRVAGVERDVPVPRGEPPTYRSGRPVERVLEVSAGWAARHGVERGDRVAIER